MCPERKRSESFRGSSSESLRIRSEGVSEMSVRINGIKKRHVNYLRCELKGKI